MTYEENEKKLTLAEVEESIRDEDGCAPDCCWFHTNGWPLLVAEIARLRARVAEMEWAICEANSARTCDRPIIVVGDGRR